MIVETENLKKIRTIAENYMGTKKKGVSRVYMIELFKKYGVSPVEIDGDLFYDITKLPKEIKEKLKW